MAPGGRYDDDRRGGGRGGPGGDRRGAPRGAPRFSDRERRDDGDGRGPRGGRDSRGGDGPQRGNFKPGARGGRDFRSGPRGGDRRGPGGPRDGPGGPRGFKGGARVAIEEHERYPGIYVSRGKVDTIITRSMAPGISIYGEKRIAAPGQDGAEAEKVEYREWNPFRSKLGAAVKLGVKLMPVYPGAKVLYLGAASGTTVSHVSDVVGPTGAVYAVEFSKRSGRDLLEVAKARTNIYPIISDARHPYKYRMIVPEVDAIFADVSQNDQARIVAVNATYFLKLGGLMMISIKASSIDSTIDPQKVYEGQIEQLRSSGFKCEEILDLNQFHRNHAIVTGKYTRTTGGR